MANLDIERGPRTALVTIVVFLDYLPREAATLRALDELLAQRPDQLRVVIRPRTNIDNPFATRAVLAAHAQDRGWPMHEQFVALVQGAAGQPIVDLANNAGVPDIARFEQDRRASDSDGVDVFAELVDVANRLGIRRTPIMFINGGLYGPVGDTAQLTSIIETELAFAQARIDAGTPPTNLHLVHGRGRGRAREHTV